MTPIESATAAWAQSHAKARHLQTMLEGATKAGRSAEALALAQRWHTELQICDERKGFLDVVRALAPEPEQATRSRLFGPGGEEK